MIRTGIHSYQMDAWNFPEKIEAGKSAKFYVEWSEGIFETKGDDAGEAYYKLGDKKVEFRMWDANKRNFTVTYIGFEGVNSTPQRVNWLHDGEMTILITQTYVLGKALSIPYIVTNSITCLRVELDHCEVVTPDLFKPQR